MADMGVAFHILEYAILRFLGRFECNLGNNSFLEEFKTK